MNKRGSHVGMILSFVLFVTSLIFIYGILQPTITTGEDKNSLLKQIEDKLPEQVSSQLFTLKFSFKDNCCETKTCFYLDKTLIRDDLSFESMNFLAKNKEGILVDSYENNGNIYFEKDAGNYLNVFFSSEKFSKEETPLDNCYPISSENYTFSLSPKSYIFESSITEFISNLSIKEFYDAKKAYFNLPSGTDFSLAFIYGNGSRFGQTGQNISTNVFVHQNSIYYVNSTADINPAFIETIVW